MGVHRNLKRRIAELERKRLPELSPFEIVFGSIDVWVDEYVIPSIQAGKVSADDMVDVVAAVRSWENLRL